MKYDLFVDESCHLEHDKIPVMCIGYVKVPRRAYDELFKRLNEIKIQYKTPVELKWNKFSYSRIPLYKALVDCFFSTPLEFRCVIIKYKERLNHTQFNQGSHDNFYYKMIYYLLRPNPLNLEYRIFLDIKDTRGKDKLNKIKEVFDNYHHGKSPFIHFQHLRSHENIFFQLTDLFIGAITYKTRQSYNPDLIHGGKEEFIKYLEEKSGYVLSESTPPWESKFNIFDQQPKQL
jgi:hypothetical protein